MFLDHNPLWAIFMKKTDKEDIFSKMPHIGLFCIHKSQQAKTHLAIHISSDLKCSSADCFSTALND